MAVRSNLEIPCLVQQLPSSKQQLVCWVEANVGSRKDFVVDSVATVWSGTRWQEVALSVCFMRRNVA